MKKSINDIDVYVGTLATSISKNATKENRTTSKKRYVRCYNCGKVGNTARTCRKSNKNHLNLAKGEYWQPKEWKTATAKTPLKLEKNDYHQIYISTNNVETITL